MGGKEKCKDSLHFFTWPMTGRSRRVPFYMVLDFISFRLPDFHARQWEHHLPHVHHKIPDGGLARHSAKLDANGGWEMCLGGACRPLKGEEFGGKCV